MGVSTILKWVGTQALRAISGSAARQVFNPVVGGGAIRLRGAISGFCQRCYASDDSADDYLADFLVELFRLDLKEE